MKTTLDALKWAVANNACSGPGEAIEWLESLPEGTTMAEAWEQCQRADWMLWALRKAKLCLDSPALHEFACRVAERALKAEVEAGRSVDARSWAAIRVKCAWLQGEATDDELRTAEEAAEEAARAAARAEAAWAAARAEAAWAAARAATRAAAARAAARAEQARAAARAEQADLLRKLLGNPFLWSTR
jgi:hypothetical protein